MSAPRDSGEYAEALERLTAALEAATPERPIVCACIYPSDFDADGRPAYGLNRAVCMKHAKAVDALGREARRSLPIILAAHKGGGPSDAR